MAFVTGKGMLIILCDVVLVHDGFPFSVGLTACRMHMFYCIYVHLP